MSSAGIFLLAAFTAITILVVLWPFLGQRREGPSPQEFADLPAIQRLAAEREGILEAIRELDFDLQTGKLEAVDYQSQRNALMARGGQVMRQIDAAKEAAIQSALEQAKP
jgi:hypothetical protein